MPDPTEAEGITDDGPAVPPLPAPDRLSLRDKLFQGFLHLNCSLLLLKEVLG